LKVFLDTSVLLAGLVAHHPHHPQASAVLRRIVRGSDQGYIATHSLAETYAVLTRLPLKPAIHPAEAVVMIDKNVVPHCEMVELTAKEYVGLLVTAGKRGRRGGSVYDALILACARKVSPERIYTFNLSDFQRLAPDLSERICSP
jgi:predicted nucleic acid-binding protein